MPLALTLQANTRALFAGSARLDAWNRLVVIEALLVARARSGFLVRWFGPRIPLAGSRLRIAIANLPALRDRYLAVEAQTRSPRDVEGLDIVQPIANMLGSFVGSLINPLSLVFVNPLTVAIALAIGAIHGLIKGVFKILRAFFTFLLSPLLPVLLGFVGPFLFAPLLFSSPEQLVEGFPLVLAVGAMLPPLTELFTVLDQNFDAVVGNLFDLYLIFTSGPGQPKVPLDLAQVQLIFTELETLADRLAVFMPLLFLTLGWLIVRVGPLLGSMAIVLPAFLRYVFSVVNAISALFRDLSDNFRNLMGLTKSGVMKMLSGLTMGGQLIKSVGGHFSKLFRSFKAFFDKDKVAKEFADWKKEVVRALEEATTKHPVVLYFAALIKALKAILTSLARLIAGQVGFSLGGPIGKVLAEELVDHLAKPSKKPGIFDRFLTFLTDYMKTAVPDHKAIIKSLPKRLTLEQALPKKLFSEQPPTVPKALLARHSFFDLEKKRLFVGGEKAAVLDRRERDLRGLLFEVVGSLLPGKISGHLEQLRDMLNAIDRSLDRKGPASRFPVKSPEDPALLRPSLGKIRLVARGASRESVGEWSKSLRTALVEQSYPTVVPDALEVS